jgi:hypothetical protein
MTALSCDPSVNQALCEMVRDYVAPICTYLTFILAAYFLVSLIINIGQASLSGSLGDPRGRAHAWEQAIAAVILFVLGVNASNIVQLILTRLTAASAASGFTGSREAMALIFEVIIELFSGLVLIGSAIRVVTSLAALNLAHQFGSSSGLSDALMSISITIGSAILVLASPWIAQKVVQVALGTG